MEDEYLHLKWTELSKKLRSRCGIFDLYSVTREDSEGNIGDFVYVDAPNWVTIIPETVVNGAASFVMVRQYRHGLSGLALEFPAGVVEPGEDPADTARRELLEETGYEAGSVEYLGDVCPNPAFMNNRVYTYVATDLVRVQEQTLDQHEILDVEHIPASEVIGAMGSTPYNNGIMMIALAWYMRR